MIESAFYNFTVLFDMPRCWLIAPIIFSCLQQAQRSYNIGMCESEWIFDTAVNVAFRCKMDDTIYLFALYKFTEILKVADVHLYELVVRFILYILEVGEITCIRQLIKVDNLILRVLIYEKSYNMAANKACATSDNYCSLVVHFLLIVSTSFYT